MQIQVWPSGDVNVFVCMLDWKHIILIEMVSLLRQAISLAIYILRGPEETKVFYFHFSHLVLKVGQ